MISPVTHLTLDSLISSSAEYFSNFIEKIDWFWFMFVSNLIGWFSIKGGFFGNQVSNSANVTTSETSLIFTNVGSGLAHENKRFWCILVICYTKHEIWIFSKLNFTTF